MRTKLLLLLLLANFSIYAQTPNVPEYVPTNGLIAFYPFNGNANDQSGNAANGVVTNVIAAPDRFGVANSAYFFNGSNSSIDATITKIPLNNSSRTISGWFKTNSGNPGENANSSIFNYGTLADTQRFSLSIYSKGYLQFISGSDFTNNDFYINNFDYLSNDWYFFTLTYDGVNISLYVNGNYVSGKAATLNTVNNIFKIGKRISGDAINEFFNGTIDDIGIWNRVLSQKEITDLYKSVTYTAIPDINFENKLIALNIDSGVPDGKVLTSAISAVTTLDLDSSSISDLTGIGDFTALTVLYCSGNNLTTIDVSKNKALESLVISRNKLSSLDLTSNTNLMAIECGTNQLTDLNTTKNPELTTISCATNKLTSIDVSQNPALISFTVTGNKITTLDLSNNPVLNLLFCNNNLLKDLNITKNPRLLALQCHYNQISSLDISKNTMLSNIKFNDNNLSSLNLKNGVNTQLNVVELKNNPNLTCIEVDDVEYSNTNWSGKKDATATFNTNCSQEYTLIPDENFEQRLINLGIDNDGKNGKVLNNSISNLKYVDLNSSSIKDLTGINGFVSLKGLRVSNNQLTTLDLSKNIHVDTLYCDKNKLRTLNLKNGNNKNFYSKISNFSNNPDLTCIQVDDVAYSNANWTDIKDTTATFNTNCAVEYVILPDTNFEQKLIDLGIDTDGLNGKITIADASSITTLDLSNSNIKDLSGIENFIALTYLDCSNNQLTTLDVSKNLALETLNASSNQISTLDLSKNGNLKIVFVSGNPLVSLNLQNGNNRNFILPVETAKKSASLYTSFLGLTTLGCIQVDDVAYSNANWSRIKESNTVYSAKCSTLGTIDPIVNQAVLYPNPTKGEVNINNITLEKVTVYDSLGKLVKTFALNSSNTDNTINLSGLPKGVYYVYLINQDAASVKKVIIE